MVITPSLRPQRRSATPTLLGILAVVFLLPLLRSHDCLFAQNSKPYALIAGTVWGPDDHPVYGIPVKIRRARDKKPKWEVYSDHHGEFAQRVPPGDCDYILTADLKGVKTSDGKPLHAPEVTVHIYKEERQDTGIHLTY